MAAGDRKLTIGEVTIRRAVPIMATASWKYEVEDRAGTDRLVSQGIVLFELAATGAVFNAMTGAQMWSAARTAVEAHASVPARDSVS